ncbi:radical SAM protein [Acidihalobacter yilgarnensis]|uniref:Radical SAM protein n=1 Tax=Acidihalobacter yilgarnensis TaxID=2819280 RepID=A0A1D8ILV3_9GAMM|nr:TatD family nuclease-associated radical SAM protein [Acidihalobacter yilgarnensis]AOU97436.1 radical SAM protein [Acidihalobacter yilgarnensis]
MNGSEINSTYAYSLHGNCYLNVTNRCTLRCRFCPKFNGQWLVQSYGLKLYREPDVDALIDAVGDASTWKEVVFCGLGEPTLRLGTVLETARRLHESGVRVRLNTDGLSNHVYGHDVIPRLANVIDAVSVSLNAQTAAVYAVHCRPRDAGAYPAVLDFLYRASDCFAEVTATAIDGLVGVDMDTCAEIADKMGVSFRRRELDKVG